MHLTQTTEHLRDSGWTSVTLGPPATTEVTAALGVGHHHAVPGLAADQALVDLQETHILVGCSAIVIDALFQRCTEGEGRVAKTVKGAGRVLTPPILTVRRVLALIHISLLLRSHTTVSVGGQGPGRRADAVVRSRSVHTVAILTVGWVLTLIHICYYCHHTILLAGVRSPWSVTVAVESPFGVETLTIGTNRLVVAFIHIHALEKVAVIVEALLTVALVARHRVLTVTLLADFISKQRALVDIMVSRQAVQASFVIIEAFPIWTQAVEFG